MGEKDKLIVGLFLAATLALTPGCGNGGAGHTHVDKNGDGYCDECQASMSQHYGSGPHYYGSTNSKSAPSSGGGHISSGTPAKAGIGSLAAGGGG